MVSLRGFSSSSCSKRLCFFCSHIFAIVIATVGAYVMTFFQFTTVWTFVQTVNRQFVMSATFVFLRFRSFSSWYCHCSIHLLVFVTGNKSPEIYSNLTDYPLLKFPPRVGIIWQDEDQSLLPLRLVVGGMLLQK